MTLHIGWPQAIWIALTVAGLLLSAKDHEKPRSPGNFWISLAATALVVSLLAWGGFFG